MPDTYDDGNDGQGQGPDQWGRQPGDPQYGQLPDTSGPDPKEGQWTTQPVKSTPEPQTSPWASPTTPQAKPTDPKAAFQQGMSQGLSGKGLTDWIQSQGISDNGLYYDDSKYYGFNNFYTVPDGKGGYTIIDRTGGGDGGGAQSPKSEMAPLPTAQSGGAGQSAAGAAASGLNNAGSQGDELYQMLLKRASQGLDVNQNDPIIRHQSDVYNAQQQQAQRNYLSQVAERQGPNANIDAETRASSEKVGQATSGFQAELMQRELTSRREEIQNALTSMQAYLTDQQRMALQKELAQLDNALQYARLNEQGSEFTRSLGQRAFEFDTTRQDNVLGG